MTFRLQSLTAAKVVSETGRTLAAFQGSDTLGSVSNMSRDYSSPADKQGHERKAEKPSMESRNRLHSSFHPAAKKPLLLNKATLPVPTNQAHLFSRHSRAVMTSRHRSGRFRPPSPQ